MTLHKSSILCVIVVQGDDDAYIIVENLRYLLDQYDARSPVYLGHLYKRFHKEGYMSGGASYVLSREALKLLVEEGFEKVRDDFFIPLLVKAAVVVVVVVAFLECEDYGERFDESLPTCFLKVRISSRTTALFKSRISPQWLGELRRLLTSVP